MNEAPFTTRAYRPKDEEPLNTRVRFKSAVAFCAEYTPLSYTVEGLVRSASLYVQTAKTGAGKTAINVIKSLAIVTGREDILGREVTKGRVAYLAFENPDDVRMRIMIACYLLNIDLNDIGDRLVILDRRQKPEEILIELRRLAQTDPFTLIIVDTLAAFFDGTDINDNVQGGEFMRRLRPFTQVPGLPSVIVSAHPIKNAGKDSLLPYGGGAILNEVDGNLTLWKRPDTGIVSLHWQGKIRGLDFKPVQFRFETCGSPEVLDVKGRQVQLPVMRPTTEESAEEKQQSEADVSRALLQAMIAEPTATQREWATAVGVSKSTAHRHLFLLRNKKLAEETLGKWTATSKGRKAMAEDGGDRPQKPAGQESG
jgi:hypothetical protein